VEITTTHSGNTNNTWILERKVVGSGAAYAQIDAGIDLPPNGFIVDDLGAFGLARGAIYQYRLSLTESDAP
jgi:hypothetical protein